MITVGSGARDTLPFLSESCVVVMRCGANGIVDMLGSTLPSGVARTFTK